jgi:hypothetical protein
VARPPHSGCRERRQPASGQARPARRQEEIGPTRKPPPRPRQPRTTRSPGRRDRAAPPLRSPVRLPRGRRLPASSRRRPTALACPARRALSIRATTTLRPAGRARRERRGCRRCGRPVRGGGRARHGPGRARPDLRQCPRPVPAGRGLAAVMQSVSRAAGRAAPGAAAAVLSAPAPDRPALCGSGRRAGTCPHPGTAPG